MEMAKIKDIFKQSECPNESLKTTFPSRYKGIDHGCYMFDSATIEFDMLCVTIQPEEVKS